MNTSFLTSFRVTLQIKCFQALEKKEEFLVTAIMLSSTQKNKKDL